MATLKYATVPISPKRGKILPVAADRDSHSRTDRRAIGVPPPKPPSPAPANPGANAVVAGLSVAAFYASSRINYCRVT